MLHRLESFVQLPIFLFCAFPLLNKYVMFIGMNHQPSTTSTFLTGWEAQSPTFPFYHLPLPAFKLCPQFAGDYVFSHLTETQPPLNVNTAHGFLFTLHHRNTC